MSHCFNILVCGCDTVGLQNIACNNGKCTCRDVYSRDKCSPCKNNYFNNWKGGQKICSGIIIFFVLFFLLHEFLNCISHYFHFYLA